MVQVFKPGDTEVLGLPGRSSQQVVAGNRGSANVTFRKVEITRKPGDKGRGPHVHHAFEECIYVVAGSGVMRTDKGEYPVAAGDTILIQAGEIHQTTPTEGEVLKFLCFFPTADVPAGTTEFASWDEALSR